jgi:hypothetical protein
MARRDSAVTFDGTGSTDPDGNLSLNYAWNFGDGTTGTGASPSHTSASAGSYTVTLTVTDAKGLRSAAANPWLDRVAGHLVHSDPRQLLAFCVSGLGQWRKSAERGGSTRLDLRRRSTSTAAGL